MVDNLIFFANFRSGMQMRRQLLLARLCVLRLTVAFRF